jgi:hypothetical protein
MHKDTIDLSSPLVCEGIVGDGCGGGRVFYIRDATLFAYDPYTGLEVLLCAGVEGAISLEKKGCILTISFEESSMMFDISKFKG